VPAHRPLGVVLGQNLVLTPPPTTHDRLGRPLIGPCLRWTRAVDKGGYGVMGNSDFGDTRLRRVHRVMYALANGLPIDGDWDDLDHLCRVECCASPAHLEEVTVGENNRRGDGNGYRDKIECINGHPFDLANTYRRKGGGRDCKTCRNDSHRRNYDPAKRSARYQARKLGRAAA
jgi:hypothetical protein